VKMCGKNLGNVWEVCGECVGSAWEMCGKCAGSVGEGVLEVVGSAELSANICKTPCRDISRNCARGLKFRQLDSNPGSSGES